MIKELKEISNIINNWRDKNNIVTDIHKTDIINYFLNDIHLSKIEDIFWLKQKVSELEENDLNRLLQTLEENKQNILAKNLEFKQSIEATSEQQEKATEMALEDIWLFMKQIVQDVQEWVKRPMVWYVELKRIQKLAETYLKMIDDLAYEDLPNYDWWKLPYWYIWSIMTRINIDYSQDPIYAEINEKAKEREKILKQVVENSKKWLSTNDSDWCVIEVPDFKYSSYLVIKKR